MRGGRRPRRPPRDVLTLGNYGEIAEEASGSVLDDATALLGGDLAERRGDFIPRFDPQEICHGRHPRESGQSSNIIWITNQSVTDASKYQNRCRGVPL